MVSAVQGTDCLTVLRKNAVGTSQRCQIFLDKTYIFSEVGHIFPRKFPVLYIKLQTKCFEKLDEKYAQVFHKINVFLEQNLATYEGSYCVFSEYSSAESSIGNEKKKRSLHIPALPNIPRPNINFLVKL